MIIELETVTQMTDQELRDLCDKLREAGHVELAEKHDEYRQIKQERISKTAAFLAEALNHFKTNELDWRNS